jgi:hypothetical protein
MRIQGPMVFRVVAMLLVATCFIVEERVSYEYVKSGTPTQTAERKVWLKGWGYGARFITDEQDRTLRLLRHTHIGLLGLVIVAEALWQRSERKKQIS